MTADQSRLLRLAEAVADDAPVDWESTSADDRAAQRLRQLAAMAEFYRSVASEHDRTPGLFRWGHLVVVEKLDEGSYGEVFRAHDPLLERDVALKLRHSAPSVGLNDAGRLIDEARRLARVRHPNVVAVFGADLHGGRVGVWTELVNGRDLRRRLGEDGPLDVAEAVRIGRQLCGALAAVHAAGLVHGDVKAANVICEPGGRVMLGDFGSCVETSSGVPHSASPATAAPEVLRGKGITQAADLYSLGALLHLLVSGRLPVEAPTLDDLLTAHSTGARSDLARLRPDLPPAFAAAVARALEPDPGRRFVSAGEMDAALATVPCGGSATVPPDRRPRRLGLAVATAAVAAVIGAVLVVRAVGPYLTPSPAPADAAHAAPPTITAELYRTRGSDTGVLSSGDLVSPGDGLHLSLDTGETVWVYVVDADEAGHAFVLFPIPQLEGANPLAAGRHRLPGRLHGVPQDWKVTSAGGAEVLLVVAARAPLPDLERRLGELSAAARSSPSSTSGVTLRGVGGLTDAAAPVPGGDLLDGLEAELRHRPAGVDPVWTRRFELRNPRGGEKEDAPLSRESAPSR